MTGGFDEEEECIDELQYGTNEGSCGGLISGVGGAIIGWCSVVVSRVTDGPSKQACNIGAVLTSCDFTS